jgi:hypothetical protein
VSALLHPAAPDARCALPSAAAAALAVLGSALEDAVLGLGPDGAIVLANPAAERLLGRPAEVLVGQSLQAALRAARLGSAALALSEALSAPLPPGAGANRRFMVHDAEGRPGSAWQVVRLPTPLALHEGEEAAAARGLLTTMVVARSADGGPGPTPASGTRAVARPEAETLAAVARELAQAGDDVTSALEQLSSGAMTLLQAEGACVVLLENGHGNVAAAAGTLTSLRGHATELMAPPSLFAQAVQERRLLIVNAATRDTRVDPRYGAAFGMRQVLVAPLLIGGEVAAVLCAVNSARGAFGESDGALAQRLADHGALALRNARLVRSAERAARHARLIADAGRALAQHVTPHSFFPALARLIEDALPANGFRILLADRGTRRIDHLFAGGVGRGLPAHDHEHLWEAVGGQVVLTGTPAFVGDIDTEPVVGPADTAYRVVLKGRRRPARRHPAAGGRRRGARAALALLPGAARVRARGARAAARPVRADRGGGAQRVAARRAAAVACPGRGRGRGRARRAGGARRGRRCGGDPGCARAAGAVRGAGAQRRRRHPRRAALRRRDGHAARAARDRDRRRTRGRPDERGRATRARACAVGGGRRAAARRAARAAGGARPRDRRRVRGDGGRCAAAARCARGRCASWRRRPRSRWTCCCSTSGVSASTKTSAVWPPSCARPRRWRRWASWWPAWRTRSTTR